MSTGRTENQLNLRIVIEQLTGALDECHAIHGCEYSDDGKNNPANRDLAARLLRLSDALALTSSMVRNEYWEGRR